MLNKQTDDEICNILHKHAVAQSVDEVRKTCITSDGFARIHASGVVIVIQPDRDVLFISTLSSIKTFAHDLKTWDEMSVLDFPTDDLCWIFWNENLKPAIFEIIELLESPDTSSETKPDHSPEATGNETVIQLRKQVEELQGRLSEYEKPLEEQAKEWVEKRNYLDAEITECDKRIEEQENIKNGYSHECRIVQKQIDVLVYRMKKLNGKGTTNDPT